MDNVLYEKAQRLVRNEVFLCVSHLVHTLAQGYGRIDFRSDLEELTEQAFELSTPVLDYEEAATEAGWTRNEHNGMFVAPTGHDPRMADYDDWEELCDAEGIEPHESEIFEHWAVSRWLGELLQAKGEKVDFDFAGMVVWGRRTTGQGIALDHVIHEIIRDLDNARVA